mmetsp:Transcript_12932/g.31524  ORF Transcript_12932/g.31524 Transcript_12932/m.31524 type:complete len:219 (-) Transcript_12932:1028-1684(-)
MTVDSSRFLSAITLVFSATSRRTTCSPWAIFLLRASFCCWSSGSVESVWGTLDFLSDDVGEGAPWLSLDVRWLPSPTVAVAACFRSRVFSFSRVECASKSRSSSRPRSTSAFCTSPSLSIVATCVLFLLAASTRSSETASSEAVRSSLSRASSSFSREYSMSWMVSSSTCSRLGFSTPCSPCSPRSSPAQCTKRFVESVLDIVDVEFIVFPLLTFREW